jgi:hypothetical protein
MSSNNGRTSIPSRKYRKHQRLNHTRSNGRPPGGKNHEGHSAGAQNGNQNALGHGLVAFRNGVHRRTRRGRSLIDRRSNIGREALSIQASYVDDLGGEKALTTGQRVVLGLLGQNLYLLGETDKRINRAIKEIPKLKNSPKGMAMLYSYRAAIENNIIRNLSLLGMERRPAPVKTLEEILSEDDQPEGP